MPFTIAVVRESAPGETRVALVPEVVKRLVQLGATVRVEAGAGLAALIPDSDYAGAVIAPDAGAAISEADLLVKIQPPTASEIAALKPGAIVLATLRPYQDDDRIKALRDARISAFALELIPRITRAQAMDILSSQAAVAGYKAVLIGALTSGKFFPMLTTAAGTIRPSTVLVIGAGVAGLQALATARRLGAITQGYDVRPETKEQVESLGAKFLDLGVSAAGSGGYARELTAEERAQQQQALADHLKKVDVVISTAAVPGRPAPKILSRSMVEGMRAGSVIVDLAAESGGNCELTRPGETINHQGVVIAGPVNVPALQPIHASEMYAKNLLNFLTPHIKDGALKLDHNDEIVAQSCVTHDGKIVHEPTRNRIEGATS